jgi:sortase A
MFDAPAARRLLRSSLHVLEVVLLVVGLGAGGWFVFVQADAAVANHRDRARLRAMTAAAADVRSTPASHRVPAVVPPVAPGAPIGELSLARVGISTVVRQGDSDEILRLGAGHIPGTALPGQAGNIGIAGHRDTIFRALRHVHAGDLISLATPAGHFQYQVVWTRTVAPTDVGVLAPTTRHALTLVTCYPFYFVGHAPKRFVVRAVAAPATVQASDN